MHHDDLIAHVAATTGLLPAEAERVIGDVVAYFDEPVEAYVRRRHHQLQTYGMRNDKAFEVIAAEVSARVFGARPLSQRQLRRIVYG